MRKAFLKNFCAEEKEARKLDEDRSEFTDHCRMCAMKNEAAAETPRVPTAA